MQTRSYLSAIMLQLKISREEKKNQSGNFRSEIKETGKGPENKNKLTYINSPPVRRCVARLSGGVASPDTFCFHSSVQILR